MDLYGHLYEGAEHRVAAELDAGWRAAQTKAEPGGAISPARGLASWPSC
jgi:hypothetical protein